MMLRKDMYSYTGKGILFETAPGGCHGVETSIHASLSTQMLCCSKSAKSAKEESEQPSERPEAPQNGASAGDLASVDVELAGETGVVDVSHRSCRRREPEAEEAKATKGDAAARSSVSKPKRSFLAQTGRNIANAPRVVGNKVSGSVVWFSSHLGISKMVVASVAKRDKWKNQLLYENFEKFFGTSMDATAAQFPIDVANTVERRVDATRSATNQYAMRAMSGAVREGLDRRFGAVQAPTKQYLRDSSAELDALVLQMLEDVDLPSRAGRKLTLDDVIVLDVLLFSGSYFPQMHTDLEWAIFQGDGFQGWYLLRNEADDVGNMFIFETTDGAWSPPGRQPVVVRTDEEGEKAVVRLNDASNEPPVLETHDQFSDLKLKPKYLAAKPGDCLVFGGQLMHMSDPRPLPDGMKPRVAMNLRVVLREPDGSIKVAVDGQDTYLNFQNPPLRDKVHELRMDPEAHGVHTLEDGTRIGYLHGVKRYDFI